MSGALVTEARDVLRCLFWCCWGFLGGRGMHQSLSLFKARDLDEVHAVKQLHFNHRFSEGGSTEIPPGVLRTRSRLH